MGRACTALTTAAVLLVAGCAGVETAPDGGAPPPSASQRPVVSVLDVLDRVVSATDAVTGYHYVETSRSQRIEGSSDEAHELLGSTRYEVAYTASPEPVHYSVTLLFGQKQSDIVRDGEHLSRIDGPWTSMDSPYTAPGSARERGEADHPSVFFANLPKATELAQTGAEEIDGVATTRFAGSLPITVLPENVAQSFPEPEYPPLNAPTFPFTLWIDGNDLPRRLTTEIQEITTTIDYLAFDQDVTVETPGPDQITTPSRTDG